MTELLTRATDDSVSSAVTPPAWLVSLVMGWHRNQSTIISTNYDTIFEPVCRRTGIIHRVLGLYPVPLTQVETCTGNLFGRL